MKKSKSMIENGNVYSGDDEGFESAPEKVLKAPSATRTKTILSVNF